MNEKDEFIQLATKAIDQLYADLMKEWQHYWDSLDSQPLDEGDGLEKS